MKKLFLLAVIAIYTQSFWASDKLQMLDGRIYEVDVIKVKKCELLIKIGSDKFLIPATEIQSVEFENVNDKAYVDYVASLELNSDACLLGKADASRFHGKRGGHIALGVLFGPFAIIGTALIANPQPSNGANTAQMSENKQYFSDSVYLDCYKQEAKGKLIGAEAIGWASWIVFVLLL